LGGKKERGSRKKCKWEAKSANNGLDSKSGA
jgi:hypothetical protein